MASNIEKKDYVGGERSGVYGTVHFPDMDRIDASLRVNARQVLWETLSGISMKAGKCRNNAFVYLTGGSELFTLQSCCKTLFLVNKSSVISIKVNIIFTCFFVCSASCEYSHTMCDACGILLTGF